MLEIQKEEIIDDMKLNIIRKSTKKTQIFLYDTQRRYDDYIMKIKYRNNGEYDDVPHYIITKSGIIKNLFNPKYSSKTFGMDKIDNKLLKISLENLGWLTKNTITGVLHNWSGDSFRSDPYQKKWREHYFWDPYTPEQMESLVILCKELCKDHKIPYLIVPSQGYLSNIIKFKGIVCKSNFLNIYEDINPSFNFNKFYEKNDK